MKLGEAIPIVGIRNYRWGPTVRTAYVELEPVDHVVAGFPVGQVNVSGEMASEPAALRESNAVRLASELREADDSEVGQLTEEMFLSWHTVKAEAMSIYRKLGVSSRNQAVGRARELSLLDT